MNAKMLFYLLEAGAGFFLRIQIPGKGGRSAQSAIDILPVLSWKLMIIDRSGVECTARTVWQRRAGHAHIRAPFASRTKPGDHFYGSRLSKICIRNKNEARSIRNRNWLEIYARPNKCDIIFAGKRLEKF